MYPKGEWGARNPTLLKHDPRDLFKNFIKFLTKEISPYLQEFEGRGQRYILELRLQTPTSRILDVPLVQMLVDNYPQSGWVGMLLYKDITLSFTCDAVMLN